METWLIQEPCALGTLSQALQAGRLCKPGTAGRRVDVPAVMATAGEIAGALACLHSQDLVHGNLSADW